MGIPVAVQHLVKDAEVFKDASLQLGTWRCCCTFRMLLRCFHFSWVLRRLTKPRLLHAFPDEDEVHVTASWLNDQTAPKWGWKV